jgi:hypothetical protein
MLQVALDGTLLIFDQQGTGTTVNLRVRAFSAQ